MFDSEKIIEFLMDSKPRQIFEMDSSTLAQVRRLHDAQGVYLWTPEPNYKTMPGRLMGVPISISKDKCFQLKFLFIDGYEHVIALDETK